MSRNNVRGPTSALTEFLRESGITPSTVAARRRTAAQEQLAAASSSTAGAQSTAEQQAGNDDSATASVSSPRRRNRVSAVAGYASDDLDDAAEEESAGKKRKRPSAAQEKGKGKARKKAKKGSDDDYEDDIEDGLFKAVVAHGPKPPAGSFEKCAECGQQFTVTRYTMAADPGPGFLCHSCAKASGADPFKKPAQPRKRKAPADKRTIVHFEEKRFPTLVSLCIQIVSRHIDDVEALGGIGAVNMDHISKTISKNRSLTAETAPLFYDVENTTLTFYDATRLKSPAFSTLALLNPNLTSLRLDLCGCIDDAAITTWCTSLPHLTRLELLGPFLVRAPTWKSFFKSHPQLEGFLITQSPRFDVECMKALIENCQNLKQLRLKEIGKMADEFVELLMQSKGTLNYLDLSYPGASLSEEVLLRSMETLGATLDHLELSGHDSITDEFLQGGIKPHCRVLSSLVLADLTVLTDEGVAEFFNTWNDIPTPNPPLTYLDLSRNHTLSTNALEAILAHSGANLHYLNINGWKAVSEDALGKLGESAKALRSLDVGWCREVNDFVIKGLMEGCERIKEVKVWGCNRLTATCPRKRGVDIYGVESHTAC